MRPGHVTRNNNNIFIVLLCCTHPFREISIFATRQRRSIAIMSITRKREPKELLYPTTRCTYCALLNHYCITGEHWRFVKLYKINYRRNAVRLDVVKNVAIICSYFYTLWSPVVPIRFREIPVEHAPPSGIPIVHIVRVSTCVDDAVWRDNSEYIKSKGTLNVNDILRSEAAAIFSLFAVSYRGIDGMLITTIVSNTYGRMFVSTFDRRLRRVFAHLHLCEYKICILRERIFRTIYFVQIEQPQFIRCFIQLNSYGKWFMRSIDN